MVQYGALDIPKNLESRGKNTHLENSREILQVATYIISVLLMRCWWMFASWDEQTAPRRSLFAEQRFKAKVACHKGALLPHPSEYIGKSCHIPTWTSTWTPREIPPRVE